jgi:hypothetical protein
VVARGVAGAVRRHRREVFVNGVNERLGATELLRRMSERANAVSE